VTIFPLVFFSSLFLGNFWFLRRGSRICEIPCGFKLSLAEPSEYLASQSLELGGVTAIIYARGAGSRSFRSSFLVRVLIVRSLPGYIICIVYEGNRSIKHLNI
jgi:hypothetical protein